MRSGGQETIYDEGLEHSSVCSGPLYRQHSSVCSGPIYLFVCEECIENRKRWSQEKLDDVGVGIPIDILSNRNPYSNINKLLSTIDKNTN
jgi:hypothetical protein